MSPRSEGHAVPEEAKRLFKRFLRGYASTNVRRLASSRYRAGSGGSSSSPSPSATVVASGVSLSAAAATEEAAFYRGLLDEEPDAHRACQERPKTRKEMRDHYELFAKVMPAECSPASSPGERDVRLNGMRLRALRGRVALCAGSPGVSGSRDVTVRQLLEDHHPGSSRSRSKKSLTGNRSDSRRRSDWRGGSSAAVTAARRAELRTREASESLRFLVFGPSTVETKKAPSTVHQLHQDAALSFEQRCGTKEDVIQLQKVWAMMDEDGSGDVEFKEFLSFFSRSKADRLLGMRCVNYLVGKAKDEGSDEREKGCTIQDMIRLIWLRCTEEDLERMMRWFHEAEFECDRVPTPPLLPEEKQQELKENFPNLDWEKSGKVSFRDLLESGFVDEATLNGLRDTYRLSQWGDLTEQDFLEMFCPEGYRAHESVRTAIDENGRNLVYVSNEYFTGWLLAGKVASRTWWTDGAGPAAAQHTELLPKTLVDVSSRPST